MPMMIEYYHEFVERHGRHPIRSKDGQCFIFPDGASVHAENRDVRQEPPADLQSRLTLQREYHAVWLERVQADFDQLKSALTGDRDGYGMPISFTWPESIYGPAPSGDSDGTAAMRFFQKEAARHRTAIKLIDAKIADLPEIRRQREAAEQARAFQAEQASRAAKYHNAVAAMQL